MVNILEMNKEQYVAWRAEKVGMSVEDITKLYDEYAEEGKLINEPNVDLYVKKRFGQAFIKKDKGWDKSPAVKMQVMVIGFQKTDYGASKQYNDSLDKIKDADEATIKAAIEQGFINENKQPLFHYANKSNKKNGTVIDLKAEMQYTFKVVAKRLDKKDEFKTGTLSINEIKLSTVPQLFHIYDIEATIGNNSDKKNYVLYGDDRTNFVAGTRLKDEQISSLLENFYKDIMFSMSDLKEVSKNYPNPNADRYNKFVLTKACVADLNITSAGKNNKILLADGLDEEAFADTWVPEEININFNNTTQDLWVYGTVSYNEKDDMPVINVYGLVPPERYIITEQPKPVTPEVVGEQPKAENPKAEEAKKSFNF